MPVIVHTFAELGELVKDACRSQGLLQMDLPDLSGTGNRFVTDLERGKSTLQLQKVLDMLGLEVRIGPKRVGRP